MAFIRQRTKTDCGIAALAMLCDVTYDEVNMAIQWRKHGCLHGTDTKMLRAAAKRFGYEGRGTKMNQLKRIKQPPGASIEPGKRYHEQPTLAEIWQALPDNSLVKVPHPKGPTWGWHWVAWRKGKIYDPALGVFRLKGVRARPSAYMTFKKETT